MIGDAGLAAPWLAAGLAVLQMLVAVTALRKLDAARDIRGLAIVQTALVAIGLSGVLLSGGPKDLDSALLLASIAVAAGGASARTNEAVRPWAVAGWTLLTLGLAVRGDTAPGLLLYATLTAWLAATVLLHWPWREREPMVDRLLNGRLSAWGALIAHVGAALALAGIAASAALTNERSASVRPGEVVSLAPWLVQLDTVVPAAGPGWTAFEAELIASRGAGPVTLKPQSRFSRRNPDPASAPASADFWSGALQAQLGRGDDAGRWRVQVSWRPFAGWARIGALIMALGGLVSLLHFARPRPRRSRERYA